jgi:hypothetical protein
MTRITVAPRECDVCGCRTVEPDAEPYGDWVWRCNVCGSVEFEAADPASLVQQGWAGLFAFQRPLEADEWQEQYRLTPEKSLT